MKNFKEKKVVVTGGGSGIGKAIIKEFYKEGVRKFAIFGRNREKLIETQKEFSDAKFLIVQGDLRKSSDIQNFTDQLTQEWGSVDLLINNAGVVSAGKLEEISDNDIIDQVSINLTGVLLLTKHTLPLLKKSSSAAIMNISSGLGLLGLPFYTTYGATKAGLKMFSEALRRELKDLPIHIMTVYPTGTDTPMMKDVKESKLDNVEEVAQKSIEGLKNKTIDVILGGKEREEDVELNKHDPLEFDKKAAERYDALKRRASKHRSM